MKKVKHSKVPCLLFSYLGKGAATRGDFRQDGGSLTCSYFDTRKEDLKIFSNHLNKKYQRKTKSTIKKMKKEEKAKKLLEDQLQYLPVNTNVTSPEEVYQQNGVDANRRGINKVINEHEQTIQFLQAKLDRLKHQYLNELDLSVHIVNKQNVAYGKEAVKQQQVQVSLFNTVDFIDGNVLKQLFNM